MKRISSVLLAVVLLVCLFCVPASASYQTVTYFPDGSYCVTTIHVYDVVQTKSARSVVEGDKDSAYFNASGDILFTLTLYGTFTYDGNTARATSADYDYDIYDTLWSLDNGRAWCTGATALAEATFSHPLLSDVVINTSLSCSPDGHLF